VRPARRPGPWHVLGLAVVAQTGVSVIDQGIPTLTGFIKTDLDVSAATAGLFVSSYFLGKIGGSYAAGVAADRFGEQRVLVLGGLSAAVLVALAAAAPLPLFVALFLLAGVAGATSTPAGGRLVLLSFPRNRHGLALGIRQTGIPVGGLVAAALLPWVAHLAGWRWALVAASAVAVAAVLPLAFARLERAEVELPHVSHGGAGNRNVRLLTLWGCMIVTGQYAVLAFLALDLHARVGLSLATGSLLVAVANASGAVGRIGWGAISDRALARGRKPLLIALTFVGLAGALALLAIPHTAPTGVFVAVAALAGVGLIGFQGLWVTMIAEAAGPERVGAATGFSVMFVQIAIASSAPLYGLVADLAGTYRAIWAALAVVLAAAFVPAALIREERP
jgi:MFS family permease